MCIFHTSKAVTCANSNNQPVITGQSPGAKYYTLGTAFQSVNIAAFTVSWYSFQCNSSDIVYSMSITPPSGVTVTSWITFNAATRVVRYVQANSGYDGAYTITIIGTITTKQGVFTGYTSFVLTVVPTCLLSTDLIIITGTSPGAQIYNIGTSSQTVTIADFTEDSSSCVANDLVYALTVSPPSSVTNFSWVTFDASTKVVSYYQTNQGFDGDYTTSLLKKLQQLFKRFYP